MLGQAGSPGQAGRLVGTLPQAVDIVPVGAGGKPNSQEVAGRP